MQKPDNYLVWAILCTVLCCMPLGVVSIVKATQVDSLWAMGRVDEAYAASEAAKKWAIWGAVTSVAFNIVAWTLYIIFVGIAIAAN